MTIIQSSLRWLLPLPLVLLACKAPQGPTPNSPIHDHQPPSTSPGDGEVIGADRVPPEQKLEEGPKLDAEQGVLPPGSPPSK